MRSDTTSRLSPASGEPGILQLGRLARWFDQIRTVLDRVTLLLWRKDADWSVATKVAVVSITLLVHALIMWMPWEPNGNSVMYMILARSLRDGAGYRAFGLPHGHFPPGYPLLLLPFIGAARGSYLWPKMLAFGSSWLVGAAVYVATRSLSRPRIAGLAALLWLLNPLTLSNQVRLMSDIPFTAIALWSLVAWICSTRSPRPWIGWVVAGILAAFGVSVRTAGVVLGPSLAVAMLLFRLNESQPAKKMWQRARWPVAMGFLLCPGLGWMINASLLSHDDPTSFSYFELVSSKDAEHPVPGTATVGDHLHRASRYCIRWMGKLGVGLVGANNWTLGWIALPVLVFTGLHLVRFQMRERPVILLIFLAVYSAMLLDYPFGGGQRFVIPVLPVLWILTLAWLGMEAGWHPWLARWIHPLCPLLVASTLVLGARDAMEIITRPYSHPQRVVASMYLERAQYLRQIRALERNVPVDSPTLCSQSATLLREVTGRELFPIPSHQDRVADLMQFWRIQHVVLSQRERGIDREALTRAGWVQVLANADWQIFEDAGRMARQDKSDSQVF